jgi:hypothetical protein
MIILSTVSLRSTIARRTCSFMAASALAGTLVLGGCGPTMRRPPVTQQELLKLRGAGAPSRRSFHASASVYIPLGVRFKRTRRGNENREFSEIGTEYFRKRKPATRNCDFSNFRLSALTEYKSLR